MKHLSVVLLLLAILLISPGIVYAEDQDLSDTVSSMSGLYSYDEGNPPEVFFFPKEKAKWDGSKITMSEWYMLTEMQKEKFLSEYLQELQSKYSIVIDVMGSQYLNALNSFSAYSNDKTLREPSTKFIDILLSGQGKVAVKESPLAEDRNKVNH